MDRPIPPSITADASSTDLGRPPLRVIVLAGRGGGAGAGGSPDPLARRFGQQHKCLVPLAGRPLAAHVLQTAASHPAVESLAIAIEREAFDSLFDVLSQIPGRGIVKLVEARRNLVDSVMAAAQGWDGALLVTTADHALLTAGSIDRMIAALDRAEAVFAMAPRDAVLAVHPQDRRRFHAFADGAFAACNLYAASGPEALRAAEAFRGGGQFARRRWRVARAVGMVDLVLLWARAVTLAEAAERLSRRFALKVAPVVLDDGSQAVDVDDDDSHALAESLLLAPAPSRPGAAFTAASAPAWAG
ncbi:NTP transferase domain-containing protein [Novosphingobium soli]|uniref:NTP transferase domain-containing protein n=1 Tax=Novosphingobium soli TaxID=574956 RepID=A0ABV6CVE3_9SPHN